LKQDILSSPASFALSLSIFAPSGFDYSSTSKFVQASNTLDSLDIDASAASTVTPIWWTFLDVLLTQERDTSVATRPSIYCRATFVLKYEPRIIVRRWIQVRKVRRIFGTLSGD
jgi:hypothetical protein